MMHNRQMTGSMSGCITVLLLLMNFFLLQSITAGYSETPGQAMTVEGIVFHDINGNGVFDNEADVLLNGVAVSNGREVVFTGEDGTYRLPLRDPSVIFVIKPRMLGGLTMAGELFAYNKLSCKLVHVCFLVIRRRELPLLLILSQANACRQTIKLLFLMRYEKKYN